MDTEQNGNSSWALEPALGEVFRHLDTFDLLRCSLVNKSWNFESRCILRDHRKCIALISGPNPCVDLLNFNNALARMNPVVPYNGLKINVQLQQHSSTNNSACVGTRNVDRNYRFLLNQFNLKYLEIQSLDRSKHCPLDQLTGRLIIRKLDTLKELRFSRVPRVFQNEPTMNLYLPNLKVLELSPDVNEPFALYLYENISTIAPNLNEISGGMNIEDLRVLPKEKYHLVKELMIHRYPLAEAEGQTIDPEALKTLKLYELNVNISIHHDSPKCWEMIGTILTSSQKSLKFLRIGACSLLNLVRTDLISSVHLENIESVYLGLVPYWFDAAAQAQIRTISKGLSFSSLFPSLKSVNLIDDHPHGFYTDCYCCMNDQDPGQLPMSCHSVRQLCDSYYLLSPQTFSYVCKMFPQVRSFECANAYPDQVCCYAQVWTSWEKLESASLSFECGKGDNFDGLFCGIGDEEVKFLQKCSDEYLSNVVIVPTKPAVTYLSNLQKLTMSVTIQEDDVVGGGGGDPNLFFLSRVTGLVAFQRMMQGVQLELRCHKNFGVFSHLVPYLNVVYKV